VALASVGPQRQRGKINVRDVAVFSIIMYELVREYSLLEEKGIQLSKGIEL